MGRVIALDSGPLGLVTKSIRAAGVAAINQWVFDCVAAGHRIVVPEVADYEVRRELVRSGSTAGIARLDAFNTARPDRYLPITTATMRLAADLWAQARNLGWATADPHALDGDVILAAQVLTLGLPVSGVVVATVNVRHLARYVTAERWENIVP